jgi:hypothetical protein
MFRFLKWFRRSSPSARPVTRASRRTRTAQGFRPGLECLEDRLAPTVSVINNFAGLVGGPPPDTCGAAGPNSYVETINSSVAIYGKNGTLTAQDGLGHFLYTVGGIRPTDIKSGLSDATMCYDEVTGQFIVGDLDLDATAPRSSFDFAVSRTSNPTTLTTADWTFYQLPTTETTSSGTVVWSDYPGNIGYNHDAVVITFFMASYSQVDVLSQSALAAGTALTRWSNHFDLMNPAAPMRPVTMHDSVAGGPMWLVSEGGNNYTIGLTRIDNILTATSGHLFPIYVNSFGDVNAPLNPDGTVIASNIDWTRILKAAEANNTIVACHHVGVGTTEDDARWYEIDVSNSNSPTLMDQGDVSAGNNTYNTFPGIDINPVGDIAMSYIRSGTDNASDFMSVYVTGRNVYDAPHTMEPSVLVQAGNSNNNNDQREGDFSGINVDPDGSFWIANEFTSGGTGATEVAHFTVSPGGEAFVKGGVLQVTGTMANDTITLQPTPGNSAMTEILDNGLPAGATSGYAYVGYFSNSSFSSINVVTFGGSDIVNVLAEPAGVSLTITCGGTAYVYVGSTSTATFGTGTVQSILGAVSVGGPGAIGLLIDDGADTTGTLPMLSDGQLTGLGKAAAISWTPTSTASGGVTGMSVYGGSGGNTFTVSNTSNLVHTTVLNTGTGNDTVSVLATTGRLAIVNNGGNDYDYLGSTSTATLGTGNVQSIQGAVSVGGPGAIGLLIDDGADTTGTLPMLTNSQLTGLGKAAAISWTPTSTASGGVTGMSVYGGSGGNTFTVSNTSNLFHTTVLNTGTGNDTVNVLATSGKLAIFNDGGIDSVYVGRSATQTNGTIQNIKGAVSVGGSGATSLVVDDSADTTSMVATITNNSVAFAPLAPGTNLGTISYSSTVDLLRVVTGSVPLGFGYNTIQVNSTAAATPLTLATGTGNTTVFIGASVNLGYQHTLASIAGTINVQANAAGRTTLEVDDSAEAGRSIGLTSNFLTFGGLPTIQFSGLIGLDVVAGTQSPPITVESVPAGVPTTIYQAIRSQVSGPAAGQVTLNANLPVWD